MKTVHYEQVLDEQRAQMTAEERTDYDAAYERAGSALAN